MGAITGLLTGIRMKKSSPLHVSSILCRLSFLGKTHARSPKYPHKPAVCLHNDVQTCYTNEKAGPFFSRCPPRSLPLLVRRLSILFRGDGDASLGPQYDPSLECHNAEDRSKLIRCHSQGESHLHPPQSSSRTRLSHLSHRSGSKPALQMDRKACSAPSSTSSRPTAYLVSTAAYITPSQRRFISLHLHPRPVTQPPPQPQLTSPAALRLPPPPTNLLDHALWNLLRAKRPLHHRAHLTQAPLPNRHSLHLRLPRRHRRKPRGRP